MAVKESFDMFKWNAPRYVNPVQIAQALKDLNLCEKKLKAIYIVGTCQEGEYWDRINLLDALRDVGIEPKDDNWWKDSRLDNVKVPWELSVCEPVQLVFEDDLSVEIFPYDLDCVRIGVNSIPIGLTDGLNNGNIDANIFFEDFIGKELKGISVKNSSIEIRAVDESDRIYERNDSEYIIKFDFGGAFVLGIDAPDGSWFKISSKINRNNRTPYKNKKAAVGYCEQVILANGCDRGGAMWITADVPSSDWRKLFMSIDDYEFYTYFSNFAYKYYDESIQEREEYEDLNFDGYGYNYYTYDNAKLMLEDIKATAKLYRECYENPEVLQVKYKWLPYGITPKELKKYFDVYERFAIRLENVLNIPGFERLCISGP